MLSLMTTIAIMTSALMFGHPEHTDQPMLSAPLDQTEDVQYAKRDLSPANLTQLDVYNNKRHFSTEKRFVVRPIIVYVHGGAWAYGDKEDVHLKPEWAERNDWLFISVNYRLSPDVKHPAHAQDVAEALAFIKKYALVWGGDPEQIVLIGHSAGAQIAAIVASEESLLGAHDMAPSDLAAVVVLDGSGYHIENRVNHPTTTEQARGWYFDAFGEEPIAIEGTDETTWTMASATLQAKPGDELPPLLAVHAGLSQRAKDQARALVDAWVRTGAAALPHHAKRKNHRTLNHELGGEKDVDTMVIEVFLKTMLEWGE
jgi:arylformamidase